MNIFREWPTAAARRICPALFSILFAAGLLRGDMLRVGPGRAYTDIQSALDAAMDGDTVLVDRGEYAIAGPINLPAKNIALRSEGGPEVTVIRGPGGPSELPDFRVMVFESGETARPTVEGFTMTGGPAGGVAFRASSPIL